ncbi:beta-glucosidase [Mycobacterium sp. 852014-52144_SCH5372336]|uniref:beta-glucosidase family protein n=1 Tax=Mycobacterium sp. 852014-52144_SCH5372336 TaxID=1834115 RepID=UPI0008002B54|nr:glycoside hydrolase family 3 N-terminal domain-containing protein [Mycobacterium sp. 852014-52144_SCH5372336]OBB76337.1 beta-glucosidase [Mycobacterium sp. 852014-52144_SCH5372336]
MTDPMTRAHGLLRQMTVDEKAMQLSSVFPLALFTPEGINRSRLDALLGNGIGHVCALGLIGHKAPEALAKATNTIQRYLVTETRLKIPAIYHNEAMSGVVAPGFTAFPTPIAMAATWDTEAVEEMTGLIRRQLRSVGLRHALGPVMDIARDARWGRISETFGEDAYLVSAMSVAYTRGLQSHDLVHGVAATGKHFIGYAVTEGGQNMAATAIGARELYDVYARPFEAAIRLAGLASVMPSYSEFDGVPVSASHAVLTALLRDKLGFTGTTVSDYVAVGFLQTRQRVAETAEDAGVLALMAGMDVETPEVFGYGEVLANAVRNGRVAESVLDRSVLRVLRDKFALGLFDDPYVAEDPIVIDTVAREGADLSARLAGRAVTLLKNDGDLLPLSRDLGRVAVIGPHADDVAAGFSTYTFADAVKMFEVRATGGEIAMAGMELGGEVPHEALMAIASELGPVFATDRRAYIESNYSAVSLADAVRELLPHGEVLAVAGTGVTPTEPVDIGAAIAAAGDADAVILAVGGRSSWSGQRTEGEGSDTADIALPAQQVALIEAVSTLGKPTVTVLSMGRPYALDGLIDELPAVLTAYYAGPYQATAIADAIFGITNPAGKLPFTMPRHVGQVPIHHAQKTGSGYRRTDADPHSGYLDMAATPLFGFGHGLSYTTFAYGPLELASDTVDAGGAVTAAVAITNSGQRLGSDVVQLYAADTATGVTLPAQQLVGFTRVDLEPGASKSVTFTLPLSVLAYTGVSGELVVEPGPVELRVGTSSTDIRARATVTVAGGTRTFRGDERAFFSSVAVGA